MCSSGHSFFAHLSHLSSYNKQDFFPKTSVGGNWIGKFFNLRNMFLLLIPYPALCADKTNDTHLLCHIKRRPLSAVC